MVCWCQSGGRLPGMALRERLLFQRTPHGLSGRLDRPVGIGLCTARPGSAAGWLAMVGWVLTARAAPLSGVQAAPMEMGRAAETDGCSRDG